MSVISSTGMQIQLHFWNSLYVHVHGKVTALGVLCCFALFVCLTLLASFFLPSHLSFKNVYMRDAEGRKKEASKVKTNYTSKEHSTPKAVTFPKKNELPRIQQSICGCLQYNEIYIIYIHYIHVYTY